MFVCFKEGDTPPLCAAQVVVCGICTLDAEQLAEQARVPVQMWPSPGADVETLPPPVLAHRRGRCA